MDDYDSSLGARWCKFALSYLEKQNRLHNIPWSHRPGTEAWDDLKLWLQYIHAGQIPRYDAADDAMGKDEDVVDMFDFLGDFSGGSWIRAERAIEEHWFAKEGDGFERQAALRVGNDPRATERLRSIEEGYSSGYSVGMRTRDAAAKSTCVPENQHARYHS